MSPSDVFAIANGITDTIGLAVAFLIIYRALSLRRILVDRQYRSRALWMALGGLSVISFISATIVDGLAASSYGMLANAGVAVIVEDIVWGFTFLALYGWIVSNINLAVSTDFFHRDALIWKRGGRFAAPLTLILGYAVASIPTWWIPPSWQTPANEALVGNLITVLFAAVTVYAALVLAVTFRRIQDREVKTYIKWVGLSVLGFLLIAFSGVPFIGVVMLYCMYRAVGSLSIRTRRID